MLDNKANARSWQALMRIRVSQVRNSFSSFRLFRLDQAFSSASCTASWQSASLRRIVYATRYNSPLQASVSLAKKSPSKALASFFTVYIH